MGGEGGFVEVDETYYGLKEGRVKARSGLGHKNAVVSLVERGGRIRSLYMPALRKGDMHDVVKHHVSPKAHFARTIPRFTSELKTGLPATRP